MVNASRFEELQGPSMTPPTPRAQLLAGIPVAERRLLLAGIPTAILEGGEGPSMVLLHGPGEFAEKWLRVLPDLLQRHHVIAPDLPGHGASGDGDRPLTSENVLAWLEQLIARSCRTPPVVVGHVLGGAIAARFAVRHSSRIEHLVLVDPIGLAPFRPAPRFALTMAHFMARPSERTYDRFMRQCSYDLDGLQAQMGEKWEPFVAYTLARARSPASKFVRRLMRELGVPTIPQRDLAQIEAPVTLIWGRHDRANRLRVGEEASSRFGWPLQVIEDCADDPPRDQPRAFLEALHLALQASPAKEATA